MPTFSSIRKNGRHDHLGLILLALMGLGAASVDGVAMSTINWRPEQTGTQAASSHLENRIDELNRDLASLLALQQPVDDREDVILRARINTRRLAIELLQKGVDLEADGALLGLAGLRVAHGISVLDESIQLAMGDEPLAMVEARESLAQFNEGFASWVDQFVNAPPRDLPFLLSQGIDSLARAIHLIEDLPPKSHWIVTDEAVFEPEPEPEPESVVLTLEQKIANLESRIAGAELSEVMRSSMERNFDFLRRGLAFEEFHDRVEWASIDLMRLLAAYEKLASSTTFADRDRLAYAQRALTASNWFGEPEHRERAIERIARLEASVQVELQLARLKHEKAPRPDLLVALRKVEEDFDEAQDEAQGTKALIRFRDILQVMIDFRKLESTTHNRGLLQVRASLLESFTRAETTIIENLDRFLNEEAVLSDPSLSSLFEHQQHVIDDLGLLEQVDGWLDVVGTINPRARRNAMQRLKIVTGWLIEPGRRNEASATLKEFALHVESFKRMPLESELRRSIELAALTGGLNESLSKLIATTRLQWIEILDRDLKGGDASEKMMDLHRLMRGFEDYVNLKDLEENATLLNRWAPWTLEPIIVDRPRRELPLRFKLATAAAVNDLSTDLHTQLGAIEMDLPLLNLINELADTWRPQIESFPGRASNIVDALLIEPDENAWLLDQREVLARLCIDAHEREHARTSGQGKMANAFANEVNRRVMLIRLALPPEPDEAVLP